MQCTKCGGTMADDAASCANCGTAVIRVRQGPPIGWTAPIAAPVAASLPEQVEEWTGREEISTPHFVRYAGFWRRAVAYVIDALIIVVLAMPFLMLLAPRDLSAWEQYSKLPTDQLFDLTNPVVRPIMIIVLPVMFVAGWLYYALSESSIWQATPGKRLLGLRVANMEGQRLSFTRASARFFGKVLTGLVPFGVGWILAGLTKRKQALHDMIAGCLVLRR
jgi:uncharacterized RDD family membrane protein YckC